MTRAFLANAVLIGALAVAAGAPPAVFAQQSDRQEPGAHEPGTNQSGTNREPDVRQPGGNVPTVSSSQIISTQGADEWLASQLRGTVVTGADGKHIGEIVDVLLDRNGRARAFLVGMGGVAGLGAKEIAIDLSQFHDMPAPGGNARAELKVPLTMEQLAAIPEFKALPVPDATTGAAPQ